MEGTKPKFKLGQLVYGRITPTAWAPVFKGRIRAVITTSRAHQTDYYTYDIKIQARQETPVDAWVKPDRYSEYINLSASSLFSSYEEILSTWNNHAGIQVCENNIGYLEGDIYDKKRQIKEQQRELTVMKNKLKKLQQRLKKLKELEGGK